MRNEIATPASQGCGGGLPAFFRAGRCQKGPYSEEHKRERQRKLGHHDRPPLRHHSDGRWLCDAYDETEFPRHPSGWWQSRSDGSNLARKNLWSSQSLARMVKFGRYATKEADNLFVCEPSESKSTA